MRKTIQNSNYESLFSLSIGSALAVALDISGSMSNEIEVVKQEILDIIDAANEGGIHPSVYILAPYTTYADLTVTKDTKEVRDVIGNLTANGSGTENVFNALQVKKISLHKYR